MNKILIYGATGYMGKLCAKEMVKQGLKPILAARSNKIQSVAQSFGCPYAIFDLKNESLLLKNLKDIDLLINLAGPFNITQQPLIRACLATGCHYLDIAGEVDEMEAAYSFDDAAQTANIMIMSGAGFGVVPTDIAAKIAFDSLPNASHLIIAYATEGGASRGTLKTILKSINTPGVKRVNHTLEPAHPAESALTFAVAGKTFNAVYNPWRADLFTAALSTNAANIETYTVFPPFIVNMMRGKMLWLRDLMHNHLLRFLPEGPSDKQLQSGATYVLATAKNSQGQEKSVAIKGPEAYLFTAVCLVAISQQIINDRYRAGFQTPSFYGQQLLDEIENVERL